MPKGFKHSEKTKKRMSKAHKGKKRGPRSEATKKKISDSNKGKKCSIETRILQSLAKIGKPSNRKGKKHSEATKLKLRLYALANPPKGGFKPGHKVRLTKEQRKNLSIAMKKVDVSPMIKARWKGHIKITKEYKHFKNKKYKEWQKKVFGRDKYTCKDCGIKGNQRGGYLEAHHIKGYTHYKKLRYKITNGITLCRKCHLEEHRRIKINNQKFKTKI